MTATTKIGPAEARKRIKAYLIRKHGIAPGGRFDEAAEILLWDAAEAQRRGWFGENSKGQVAWEGGPFEWAYALADDAASGKLSLPGYWVECSTSWCVALYPKDD